MAVIKIVIEGLKERIPASVLRELHEHFNIPHDDKFGSGLNWFICSCGTLWCYAELNSTGKIDKETQIALAYVDDRIIDNLTRDKRINDCRIKQ